MARPVILILSSEYNRQRGEQDAIRDTWGKNCPIPRIFVLGEGCTAHSVDELSVKAPDRRRGMALKLREALRWGVGVEALNFFICCVDTYVHVPRLLASGFEPFHYVGNFTSHRRGKRMQEGGDGIYYCHGGAGYWIGRVFADFIVKQEPDSMSDDVWIGSLAVRAKVPYVNDERYVDGSSGICGANDNHISAHLSGIAPNGEFNSEMMREAHRKSLSVKPDRKYKPTVVRLQEQNFDRDVRRQLNEGTRLWTGRDLAMHKTMNGHAVWMG